MKTLSINGNALQAHLNHGDTEGECSTIRTVTGLAGRAWMDRNLGASQVATSSTDAASYGDLYQWGRGADGHQLRTSATTDNLSSTDTPIAPDDVKFILASSLPYDWRDPQNHDLWQPVSGVNNPCPTGFRIPTEAEWEEERSLWSSQNSAGAFASPLKLTLAGYRLGQGRHAGEV